MFIEKIWPYLPTPLVYAVVVGEAVAALLLSQNHVLLALLFLWVLVLAFVLGAWMASRPFHIERLALIMTLAIAHVSMIAGHLTDIYEFLHLHDARSTLIARIAYSLIWLALTGAALMSFARTRGLRVARIWPLVIMLSLFACLFPIEPDAFIFNQPGWMWILRVHIAFVTFMLVSIGDVMSILIFEYQDRAARRRGGHSVSVPDHHNVDVSLIRTLVWSPVTLWVLFVPRILLPLALVILPYLLYTLVNRWVYARAAHLSFLQLLAATMDGADTSHNETIINMVTHFTDAPDVNYMRLVGVTETDSRHSSTRKKKHDDTSEESDGTNTHYQRQQQQQQQYTSHQRLARGRNLASLGAERRANDHLSTAYSALEDM